LDCDPLAVTGGTPPNVNTTFNQYTLVKDLLLSDLLTHDSIVRKRKGFSGISGEQGDC